MRYKWFFYRANLQVHEHVRNLLAIMRAAKAAGYNGFVLADYKLQILDIVPDEYFSNLETIKTAAVQLGLEIIPMVCPIGNSNGLLSHNPNLAEGLPVRRAPFVVRDGKCDLMRTDATLLDRDQITSVSPWRQYHLSVAVKTRDFQVRKIAAAVEPIAGPPRAYFDWPPATTQDWTVHHAVFNSLGNDRVLVRPFGWLAGGGNIEWKDARLEEIGLLNLIRREGAPLVVASASGDIVYKEGRDFEFVKDERLGVIPYPGRFEIYHPPPSIMLAPNSRIKEGERLQVSFYHSITVREEQVSCCLSDPAVYELARDQISRVETLLRPKAFFVGHDEIRAANWCEACTRRGWSAGDLVAESVRRCVQSVRAINPQAKIIVWSDMFDPFHNAHDHYFCVNGNLAGSWLGLDQDVIVANWNFLDRERSLAWFASRGHRQIVAGYYDSPTSNFSDWMKAIANIVGIEGAMYTTWVHEYDHLDEFARLAQWR